MVFAARLVGVHKPRRDTVRDHPGEDWAALIATATWVNTGETAAVTEAGPAAEAGINPYRTTTKARKISNRDIASLCALPSVETKGDRMSLVAMEAAPIIAPVRMPGLLRSEVVASMSVAIPVAREAVAEEGAETAAVFDRWAEGEGAWRQPEEAADYPLAAPEAAPEPEAAPAPEAAPRGEPAVTVSQELNPLAEPEPTLEAGPTLEAVPTLEALAVAEEFVVTVSQELNPLAEPEPEPEPEPIAAPAPIPPPPPPLPPPPPPPHPVIESPPAPAPVPAVPTVVTQQFSVPPVPAGARQVRTLLFDAGPLFSSHPVLVTVIIEPLPRPDLSSPPVLAESRPEPVAAEAPKPAEPVKSKPAEPAKPKPVEGGKGKPAETGGAHPGAPVSLVGGVMSLGVSIGKAVGGVLGFGARRRRSVAGPASGPVGGVQKKSAAGQGGGGKIRPSGVQGKPRR